MKHNVIAGIITALLAFLPLSSLGETPSSEHVYISMNMQDQNSFSGLDSGDLAGVDFVEDEGVTALAVGENTRAVYTFDRVFPLQRGSLELRFKPEEDPEIPGTLLKIAGTNFDWSFVYHPSGKRWIFRLAVDGQDRADELILWHGVVKAGKWNHVVLSWDREEEPLGEFAVYLNGKWKAKASYSRHLKGPVSLELGGEAPPNVLLDELCIYQRPLTGSQSEVLFEALESGENRFSKIDQKLQLDDEDVARRKELVGRLEGKVGRLMHRKNSSTADVKFPEGIMAKAILPQDIGQIDLSQFDVIYFPEGPRYDLDPSQYEHIREYVRNGGGYVGSCQGAYLAHDMNLLDFEAYPLNIWGIFAIIQKPSPINQWRKGQIHMHFGNGPVMIPGEGCQVVATYVMKYPDLKDHPAAILMGEHDAGRVILFGPHPLGGKVSRNGVKAYFSGKDLGTEKMLVDAFLYAAKITDFPKEN